MTSNFSILWFAAVIGVAFLITNLVTHFSSDARTRKRRRRNYSPVVCKAKRPMVRFSVRTK